MSRKSPNIENQNQMNIFPNDVYETRANKPMRPDMFRLRVASDMARAIAESGKSREQIASEMKDILSLQRFSKTTLDAYTAPSKDAHDMSLIRTVAFIQVTGATWFWDRLLSNEGLTVLEGEEAKLAELARLQQEKKMLNTKIREVSKGVIQPANWRGK